MEQKRFVIFCPVCGKLVCKAALAVGIEAKCPSCKNDLQADLTSEERLTIQVVREHKAV